ncbi:parallel beta-helix domain-containing protein [Sediminitomix flava]|uniref:Parallel beta-helix repeat protein n=1 Tax=Sediminitomix flava TaxID=379075 RepID=A0A315Z6Q5_SEDFL|nr:parallel beta-helix domain-containing protein [Sediminitomix flava]PWJ40053.1 parallel beta-helix repeat protein [Sediminitomix flava]
MRIKSTIVWLSLIGILGFSSCTEDDATPKPEDINISASETAAEDAQLAFIEVEDGQTIVFGEGVFNFTNTLSMDGKKEITIIGAGKDKTFLDFNGQIAGGDGVLITNSTKIRVEGLTIRDSKGDALKTRDCNTVSFVSVGTVWSGEPRMENGAYGLYPVLCTEVYIDDCYAYGASDAGIYVGQSDKVIVKNSVAEGNVAGIEIENTTNADVFDNEAFDNTGAILVFDLPGLTKYGSSVRVFNNNCHDNNRKNFAPEGNIVANVPAGTGCMVLSTKDVEIFENTFDENNFASVIVANYLLINQQANDPLYNPFPSGIYIHDNSYTMSANITAEQPALIQQLVGVLGLYQLSQPHIFIDGIIPGVESICIQESNSSFVNLNALDQTFQSVKTDISAHDCTKDPLSEVEFSPF